MAKVRIRQVAPIDGKLYVVTTSGLLAEKFTGPNEPFHWIDLPEEPTNRAAVSKKPKRRR
jgi:hypothetical protein